MTCHHAPRHISFPGGEAMLTANGNWTMYLTANPREVFGITACPACRTPLWGLPPTPPRDVPEGTAYAMRRSFT